MPKLSTRRVAPADTETDALQRQAEAIALDRARRRDLTTTSITMVLTINAELRFTATGAGVVHISGWDGRVPGLSAVWCAPEDFDRDRIIDVFNGLRAGALVHLDGSWRSHDFQGAKLFHFVAQYLTIGEDPPIP